METSSKQKRAESDILPELEACPFLGLEQDSATWLAYPHPANFCHAAKPTCNLSLTYQESTCLTKEHASCPGYINGWNGPLPEMYCGEKSSERPARNLILPALVAAFLLLTITGWFAIRQGWLPFLNDEGDDAGNAMAVSLSQTQFTENALAVPTQTRTQPPVPTKTPDIQLTQAALAVLNSPTPTSSPTEGLTPTPAPPTPGPAFNTPFGPGEKYLLHQLLTGESLGTLVSLYNTNNRVIEASNVLISGASIWPGTVLLIVPGEKNTEALVRFRVVLLESPTAVDDLAAQYSVSAEDIRLYNSLGPGDTIPAGRYIIIPVL